MIISLSTDELLEFVRTQLNHFFPDKYDFSGNDVKAAFDMALERAEECFRVIAIKGYQDKNGNTMFSHLHGDQYASFLYFLSNSLWKYSQNAVLCDKLLYLNKTLHSIFISYKNNMTDHFVLAHPLGTVLGNAVYGDYLFVSQGVTVNTSSYDNGDPAPVLGRGLFLAANAQIIGNQPVGNYVSIGVNTMVYQREIPDNSVVTQGKNGKFCEISTRKKEQCKAQQYFNVKI